MSTERRLSVESLAGGHRITTGLGPTALQGDGDHYPRSLTLDVARDGGTTADWNPTRRSSTAKTVLATNRPQLLAIKCTRVRGA